MNKNIKVTGIAEVVEVQNFEEDLSSLKGALKGFNNLSIILNDKVVDDYPMISGNSVKGLGRRLLMSKTWKLLELPYPSASNIKDQPVGPEIMSFLFGGWYEEKTPGILLRSQSKIMAFQKYVSTFPFVYLLGGRFEKLTMRSPMIVDIQYVLSRELVDQNHYLNCTHLNNNVLPPAAEVAGIKDIRAGMLINVGFTLDSVVSESLAPSFFAFVHGLKEGAYLKGRKNVLARKLNYDFGDMEQEINDGNKAFERQIKERSKKIIDSMIELEKAIK